MKKLYIIPILLFFSGTLFATNTVSASHRNAPSSVIFTEQNVEFAIYPDGQFDFYYRNPSVVVRRPGVNISYNAGYNYDPYLQFDDYGAVIQIENVPVYYDYYGRISRAGNVLINYNRHGRLSNVGGMHISYNHYGKFGHFQGYINRHNRSYVHRPWHRYYTLPPNRYAVVYSKPYRSHYVPQRVGYNSFRKSSRRNRSNMDHNYYRPSERVSNYSRGIRSDSPRVVRENKSTGRSSTSDHQTTRKTNTRSNTQEIHGSENRRISEKQARPEVKNNPVRTKSKQTRTTERVSTPKRTTNNNLKRGSKENSSTRRTSTRARNKSTSQKPQADNSRKSTYNRVSTSSSKRSQSSRRR